MAWLCLRSSKEGTAPQQAAFLDLFSHCYWYEKVQRLDVTVSHQIKQRFLSAFIQEQAVNQDHCNPSGAGTCPTVFKLTSTGQRRELPSWELQLQFQMSRAQPSALESGCDSCSSRLLQTSNIPSAIFHLLCKPPPRTQSLVRAPGKMNC